MFLEELCQIGFTKNESKVYLELLKLGTQAVSIIAKKSGLNRTTTYSILRSLEKKGVISSYVQNSIKVFSANDPNSLVGYLDQQCNTFDYYKTQILGIIPKFRALVDQYDFARPTVGYYDGVEGVKQLMYDALSAKDVFRAYLALPKWLEFGLKNFLLEYKDFRITNKKVPLRAIVPETPAVRAFFEENYDASSIMTKLLYVDQGRYAALFENEMNIYNDQVSILHLDKGEEYGVVLKNQQIADMHKAIFDQAWVGLGGKVEDLHC